MIDPVCELKIRAQILHRALGARDAQALTRLRALRALRRADPPGLEAAAARIQRKHCLAVVALEQGFDGWEHATRVLNGDVRALDHGTLLYGARGHGHMTIWFACYDEAREVASQTAESYLLAYKRQFFVTDRHFIASLGLDADDDDWRAIGWDWPRPASREARTRLYGKLLGAQREQAA